MPLSLKSFVLPMLVVAILPSHRAQVRRPVVVTIEANDFALALPARVPAGVVTFRLVNHGKESHHAQVVRLEGGRTAGDFVRSFTDTAAMPAWVTYLGGPVGTAPGQVREATTRLTPGRYAMVCRIASPDGRVHVMKGMIREFEVVAEGGSGTEALPAASDTVTLSDYAFAAGRPLTAGHHTILVANAGPQPHEAVMLKLGSGKTPADFAQWGLAGRHGPAPAVPVGGAEFLDVGASGVFAVNLVPGEYGYICFVPDAKDGKRHLRHGMVTQFTVR
jgi:hypothetical protein